jgi:hypothetical protein
MAPVKAVIYARVSTAEQVDGKTSLTTQEAECRTWCERHGYDVAKVYTERGESAKTSDRPQLIHLLTDCAKLRPAIVIVWKFDRWARNSDDHAVTLWNRLSLTDRQTMARVFFQDGLTLCPGGTVQTQPGAGLTGALTTADHGALTMARLRALETNLQQAANQLRSLAA